MIRIITVGNHKEYNQFHDYLSKCKDVQHITVKSVKNKNHELVKEKEGKEILSKISEHFYALSEEGEQLRSVKFAKLLECKITFVIGGAYGLSQEVKDKADKIISLTSLTMPHELAHLILIEQIYRGQKILDGHPYHKE